MTPSVPPSTALSSDPKSVTWASPARREAFERWLAPLVTKHRLAPATLRPASADASFRRYLRIDAGRDASLIVMDAPPPQENVRPFIHVAGLIGQAGLHGPEVIEADVEIHQECQTDEMEIRRSRSSNPVQFICFSGLVPPSATVTSYSFRRRAGRRRHADTMRDWACQQKRPSFSNRSSIVSALDWQPWPMPHVPAPC